MLNKRTTFIVGAGASKEVDLPLGAELVSKIAEGTRIKFQWGRDLLSGDEIIVDAIAHHCQSNSARSVDPNTLFQASRRLSQGLDMLPLSIDTYLDSHASDSAMVFVGKLAIARYILATERRSRLFFEGSSRNTIDYSRLHDTWLPKLQNLLFSGIKKEQIKDSFANASFIVFNYDRCLEHFLFNAIKGYFHVGDDQASKALASMRIIHPYGSIAPLRWQSEAGGLDFGYESAAHGLLAAADRIRLFTEGSADAQLQDSIKECISQSEQIVFLGFAYHDQNLKLIARDLRTRTIRMFGTGFGISSFDIPKVRARVGEIFGQSGNADIDIQWTCAQFFEDTQYTIRS